MPVEQTARSLADSAPPGFVTARVLERHTLTPQIEQFRIRVEGDAARSFSAGAHLEVLLPLANGEEVRHYSVCSAGDHEYLIAVLNEPGGRGGSQRMHEEVIPGAEVLVRGPRNTFPFTPTGPVLFVAGGIGITPFLSMIAEAELRGIEWRLLYLGQHRDLMAYAEEFEPHAERVTLWESRVRGRADLAALVSELPPGTQIYACGPEPMQTALRAAAAQSGHEITIEDFTSGQAGDAEDTGGVSRDGRPSLPFTVELADGAEIQVGADESILDALNEAGFRALSSCKRGTCGTCETPILEGTADHRDSVLSEEEQAANETMMICVSRACGDRIVLDL